MGFLRRIFRTKEEQIDSYADFWNWFRDHERTFFKVVKGHGDIEREFFDKMSPKLSELKEGIHFLTGMYNDQIAELIITPEGSVKNIVFVEELVNAAPRLKGWKFTAMKPEMGVKDVNIRLGGYEFTPAKMHFYPDHAPQYPDAIDITVIHDDLTEENRPTITNGIYIFLDNFLGELNFVTNIDNLSVTGKADTHHEPIPMEKLKDYLVWRQKEFVEKYDGVHYNTADDSYAAMEARLKNGKPLLAVINTALLRWDRKVSHPWILSIELEYEGDAETGMPDDQTYELLDELEDRVNAQLKDLDGYLNIGRETADNVRTIYFACKDFRKPSKVLSQLQREYANKLDMDFEIYKDKYWRFLDHYNSTL